MLAAGKSQHYLCHSLWLISAKVLARKEIFQILSGMDFDEQAAFANKALWRQFVSDMGVEMRKSGWQGDFCNENLASELNRDIASDAFFDAIHMKSKNVQFAEDDGAGIPGSADFVDIVEYGGLFFVTGSCMSAGPFDSLACAIEYSGVDEAG